LPAARLTAPVSVTFRGMGPTIYRMRARAARVSGPPVSWSSVS